MKTQLNVQRRKSSAWSTPVQMSRHKEYSRSLFASPRFLSVALLFVMACAVVFVDAVLPLKGVFFYLSFPDTQLSHLLLLPTRILFPGLAIDTPIHYLHVVPVTSDIAWIETGFMALGILALFLCYVVALRKLPRHISRRFILLSTALLGLLFVLYPAMTSQDVFSYIAYARLGAIYHLNPLTAVPDAIPHDPVYPYIFWTAQPSAYGPVWAILTCGLQWLLYIVGFKNILSMTLVLRFLGLAAHLGSVQLIWLLGGSLQSFTGVLSNKKRVIATLAFAWNPLLLFEACTNAHNDTIILFVILLTIWCLLPREVEKNTLGRFLAAIVLLAIATSIKVTLLILFPLLVLYAWKQLPRRYTSAALAILSYVSVIVLLYAPFWQHGAVLHVFKVNPTSLRDINSPYEFAIHFYENLMHRPFVLPPPMKATPAEVLTHITSYVLFCVFYGIYLLHVLLTPKELRSLPSLLKAMALVWLVYCLVGSSWLWPWYFTIFFGLFALIEMTEISWTPFSRVFRMPLAMRFLAFTLLGLYCFACWGPLTTFVPFLYQFQWAYLRGVWLLAIPLLAARYPLPAFLKRIQRATEPELPIVPLPHKTNVLSGL